MKGLIYSYAKCLSHNLLQSYAYFIYCGSDCTKSAGFDCDCLYVVEVKIGGAAEDVAVEASYIVTVRADAGPS